MNKFILILTLSLTPMITWALDTRNYDRLPTAQKDWVDSLMTRYTFSEKIAQLFWFKEGVTEGNLSGGIAYQDPSRLSSRATSTAVPIYKILDLSHGFKESNTQYIPFPNNLTRKSAGVSIYKELQLLYDFDFWLDISPESKPAEFYGVTMIGSKAVLKGFSSQDSLIYALVNYDQVFWVGKAIDIEQAIDKRQLNRKTSKLLTNKVKESLALKKIKLDEKRFKQEALVFNAYDYELWKWEVYTSGITLTKGPAALPITELSNTSICVFSFDRQKFSVFEEGLAHYTRIINYESSGDVTKDRKRLRNYDYVIIPIAQWDDEKASYIKNLDISNSAIVVNYAPLDAYGTPQTDLTHINVWQSNETTLGLAPQLIFGALGFKGTWPLKASHKSEILTTEAIGRLRFTPPHLAAMDKAVLDQIEDIVVDGIAQEAFPGCQILIAKAGQVVYHKSFGFYTYDSVLHVDENTIYDLASLTKVLSTTQAVMFLEERNLIELDEPLSKYLPQLMGSNKEDLTIREIMAHQAGLFPYLPFWAKTINDPLNTILHHPDSSNYQIGLNTYLRKELADSILVWSIQSELIEKEDANLPHDYKYSDIGFYLLKAMVERLVSQPLDEFLDQNLYNPLGMSTCYSPLCQFPLQSIVPTELDAAFREEMIQGFVHDRNAAVFGGVSGHAGLFGSALDIAKLLQMHLQMGSYGDSRYFYPETITLFTDRQFVGNRRGLGWDKPGLATDGPVSNLASDRTYGHTGFTGTGIWADPEEELIFVFLSNRVYPSADNLKLVELNIRTRIQDLAYGAIMTEQ